MKRVLVWYMHPDPHSFNRAILDTYVDACKSHGLEVQVRMIKELQYSPHLEREEYEASLDKQYPAEIKEEHHWLRWADAVTLIFPLWWGSFPAAGKGFLDRVLSYGVAYELNGETPVPKMNGKKAAVIYTTGTPPDVFRQSSQQRIEDTWKHEIFSFCGFESLPFLHFGDVVQTTDEKRRHMLQQVRDYAKEQAAKL
ncbi:NAD(P)H dehydrogenase (quinone) [Alteribacillus persepolensis]|uniref:NAD(P)H dehydrogenase (Quinone) n=1 Tax=Alteribacillus persepolensis TaxID=568899 RepID=A0A1G8K490_9BACI|nr:NAD(P)H-dependent oxidoreductase [Alteribacillus persepolensis]SDI37620.1 NAD(P)H dehydrogenase (quinone) [Alteribacillus persepolensis]